MKTPPGAVASGKAGAEKGIDKTDYAVHGPLFCQCRINQGCLFCRRWDRTIRGVDARRADSLRRQSMGDLMLETN